MKSTNILMVSESNFPGDIRIRQEALTLIARGHRVLVLALKGQDEKWCEDWRGAKVYRLPKLEFFRRGKQIKIDHKQKRIQRALVVVKAAVGYGFEYLYFTSMSFICSLWISLRHRIDVVHTHNPPDTLFLIASFYKILGKKFVYDHHDLSPELFLTKYGDRHRIIYRFLLLLERVSCRIADRVIATNESYKRIEIQRNRILENKVFVVRNGPDLTVLKIVRPDESIRKRAKIILCYLGAINVQDGVEHLLEVLHNIVHRFHQQDVCLMIIGDGDFLYEIRRRAAQMSLMENILFTGYVGDRERMNQLLSSADIFLDSAPQTYLNDHSTFIKHMEYMVFGKPIVSFALHESLYTLGDCGIFVTPGDTEEYTRTLMDLFQDVERRERIGMLALERVGSLSWEQVSKPLIALYEGLSRMTA